MLGPPCLDVRLAVLSVSGHDPVGNYIYDPCFADQTTVAHFVLCPLYRPGANVLRINLTRGLPATAVTSQDPTRHQPWAMRLANGRWCTFITGATGLIAGMRINYGCTGGGILIGEPRRSSVTWSIFYAASFKANQYRPVSVREAWW
jgi:hypothetical protein